MAPIKNRICYVVHNSHTSVIISTTSRIRILTLFKRTSDNRQFGSTKCCITQILSNFPTLVTSLNSAERSVTLEIFPFAVTMRKSAVPSPVGTLMLWIASLCWISKGQSWVCSIPYSRQAGRYNPEAFRCKHTHEMCDALAIVRRCTPRIKSKGWFTLIKAGTRRNWIQLYANTRLLPQFSRPSARWNSSYELRIDGCSISLRLQ